MSTAPPHLATGWEPDAPVDDSILRQYLFHWAAYCEAIALAAGGTSTWTDAFAAADLGRPSGYYNSATLLAPPGPDLVDRLEEIEAFFVDGDGEALLWSAWPLPGMADRGWRLEGHPPLMVRPPSGIVGVPEARTDLVREVHTAEDLARWERVVIDGYPLPALADAGPGAVADPTLLDDTRLRFWLGEADGVPASIGTLFVDHGVASLALGATLPAVRRRGHWLAHAAARLAAERDCWFTGVFSDHSAPGARSIGFVPVLRLSLWSLDRR